MVADGRSRYEQHIDFSMVAHWTFVLLTSMEMPTENWSMWARHWESF